MILSYCYLSLDETSEGTVSNIESTLEERQMDVEIWRVSFETFFMGVCHDTPPTSNLKITNAKNAVPATDNCNPENKARELLDARIGNICKKAKDTGEITLHFNLIFKH